MLNMRYLKFRRDFIICLPYFFIFTFLLIFVLRLPNNRPFYWALIAQEVIPLIALSTRLIFFASYPEITDSTLKVKWVFIPFMNKEWTLKEIEYISFDTEEHYRKYRMTIHLRTKDVFVVREMTAMSLKVRPQFIQELQSKGVCVKNNERK